jgi:HK97 family phage major capsid protein
MDSKVLNKRKSELINQQELMLKKSVESKVALTESENAQFDNFSKELDEINVTISRIDNVNKGKQEVGTPSTSAALSTENGKSKFYAFKGGYKPSTALNVDEDYTKKFWHSLRSKSDFDRFMIQNAALCEGGTTADGSALVPIETDPSIPNLVIEETAARSLSRVITTEMDLNVPYQSAKTVAALKAESNNSGTNAFATNVPTFATTKLSAYMVGDSVYASWELLQDAKAASQFITADLARAIRVQEEHLFIAGSGTGQPQGYLGNATTAAGASITAGAATLGINPILDTMATLNKAYYSNAKWLVNRAEAVRLLKAQLAANQYQTYFGFENDGNWTLLGFPMEFSAEMASYVASPATNGNWLFGDFASFAVIGDRGDSNIKIKVLDQVAALNGQTVILGYRRVDQRIILQEAVVQLNTNG